MRQPFEPDPATDPGLLAEQAGRARAEAKIAAGHVTEDELRAVAAFFARPKGGGEAGQMAYFERLHEEAKKRGLV